MTGKDGDETMKAEDLIARADQIRMSKGMSQAQWGKAAGLDDVGMAVWRTYRRGNCKLSTMIKLLDAVGCELVIKED